MRVDRLDVALIPPAAIGFFPVRPCQPAAPMVDPVLTAHGTRIRRARTSREAEDTRSEPGDERQAEELQPAARLAALPVRAQFVELGSHTGNPPLAVATPFHVPQSGNGNGLT